jgi:sugar phosphate permease
VYFTYVFLVTQYSPCPSSITTLYTGVLCPLLWVFAEYMNEIPVTILLLLLAFMGCLVGGPNNIITSAVAADLADDPSIKGNNKVTQG